MSSLEDAKRAAAKRALDDFLVDGVKRLGIGTGSTVVQLVSELGRRLKSGDPLALQLEACVPSSFQAHQLIVEAGLPIGDLSRFPRLHLAIDGADEVDSAGNCIKGGGGAMTQEKVVATCADRFVVVADYTKQSEKLGERWNRGVPIEVLPMAYAPVMGKIRDLGGKPVLRMGVAKAGPVVTDNGGFIIDADFGIIDDPEALDAKLQGVVGIVETGLFVNGIVYQAYFGQVDGSVKALMQT